MHFKGSTDLVNSAKLQHFEAFIYIIYIYIYIYTIVIMNRSQAEAALLLYYRRKKYNQKYWVHPISQTRKDFGEFHTLYKDLRKYPGQVLYLLQNEY